MKLEISIDSLAVPVAESFKGSTVSTLYPRLLVCWCVTPIRHTSRDNIVWHASSIPYVAESTLIRSVADPLRLSKTI
jgi:hypothetical protein